MKNPKKYYLVGICGTAMASLAGMLKSKGYLVSGSDSDVYPPMSTYLDELGIRVYNGYKSENLLDATPDIVVIGNAVSRGNPEVEQVLDSGIRYQSMAETVKELFIRGKHSIVVSGTHGKTTTTAMLAWMLEVARRKPSFLVGGIAENFGGSFQLGPKEFSECKAHPFRSWPPHAGKRGEIRKPVGRLGPARFRYPPWSGLRRDAQANLPSR